jgi:hypothetical protein
MGAAAAHEVIPIHPQGIEMWVCWRRRVDWRAVRRAGPVWRMNLGASTISEVVLD